MACRVAIITPENMSEWVDITLNIDAEKLKRHIIVAQDRFLKPILCKALLDELLTQIENGDVTSDYQLLIDAITPALSFWAYSRYLNTSSLDSTEKGLRTWKEDNSDVITDKRLGELIKQADQDALSYEYGLKLFLSNNASCYSPFYDNCGCDNASSGGFKITSIGKGAKKGLTQETVTRDLLDHQ